jgi:hypothetical protein
MAYARVEVKLKFTGDASGGSKAMADLQAQAGKTSKAMADVQTQANRAGKAVADMNNGGGKDAAANSSLMIWGKIAAGVYIASKAIDGLTKAMKIFGDTETSVTEKWRMGIMAIAKEIPILGGLIGGLEGMIVEGMHGDAIRGTAKNKQLTAVAAARNAANSHPAAQQEKNALADGVGEYVLQPSFCRRKPRTGRRTSTGGGAGVYLCITSVC